MKNILLPIMLSAFCLVLTAQQDVVLKINQKAGDANLESSTGYTVDAGYDLNFTRLQYYISDITIVHDGGQETKASDVYILVNALSEDSYELGNYDVSEVEGIRFYIGVDPKANHSDPTLWPNGHPLALQNPTMHWGWAAGYRFAAIEGKAGNRLAFTYQVHALGDQHYGEVALDVAGTDNGSEIEIKLDADYLRLFDGLDVSFGLIEHSDAPKAGQLLTNLKENVFTAASSTGTFDQTNFEGRFDVLGNPSVNGKIVLSYEIDGVVGGSIQLLDMSGRTIQSQIPSSSKGEVVFDGLTSGIYKAVLREKNSIAAVRPVIVR